MISLLNSYAKKDGPKDLERKNNTLKNPKNTETSQKMSDVYKKLSTSSTSAKIQSIQNVSPSNKTVTVKNDVEITTDEKESSSFSSTQSDEMEIENSVVNNTPKPSINNEKENKVNKTLHIRLENLKKARENQKKNLELKRSQNLNHPSSDNKKQLQQNKETSVKTLEEKKNEQNCVSEKENVKYKRKSKMEKYKLWNKDCYFISIDPPVKLPDESKTRYKICFKYFCAMDNKVKRKTICFGRKDMEYLVDHNNDERNKMWLSKQRGYYTPFHKNFWINYLLCSENSVNKAYNKCLEMLLQ